MLPGGGGAGGADGSANEETSIEPGREESGVENAEWGMLLGCEGVPSIPGAGGGGGGGGGGIAAESNKAF